MARKRVHAIRRGPDGSAFQNCESCGLSVAIALADMHDCEINKNVCKKLKSRCENGNVKEQKIEDQPRSAFRFFMEEFSKTCNDGNEVEIDKKGFETWKNMSKSERLPFVLQADKLNSAYVKMLHKEESEIQWVDDEVDSAEVGIYDEVDSGSSYLNHTGASLPKIRRDRAQPKSSLKIGQSSTNFPRLLHIWTNGEIFIAMAKGRIMG